MQFYEKAQDAGRRTIDAGHNALNPLPGGVWGGFFYRTM